ncbi:hypothetical protein [Pseudomonas parakoreensis]|uniref:hypothetical protein n=1 Tax=Pseudomonas parakoreensis TaxID=2892331 RepID=UPI003FD2B233
MQSSTTPIACLAMQLPCGSELARESGVSININAESAAAIAGKPAPTGISVVFNDRIHYKFCGSWLASDEAGPGNSCID